MTRTFVIYFGAGLVLGLLELCFTLARGYGLFLAARERGEYALAALSALSACTALLGLVIARASAPGEHDGRASRLTRAALVVLTGALAALAGHALSAGRRVRDLPYRYVVVACFALSAGAALWFLLPAAARVASASLRKKRAFSLCLFALAGLCLCLDAWVFPRGYPAFHFSLFALSLLFTCVAALPWSGPEAVSWFPHGRVERRLGPAALTFTLLAPLFLWHLAKQPNASYVATEHAPFTRKLLAPWLRTQVASSEGEADTEPAAAKGASGGVDLRDRDLLLITVDALRADLLRVYGGTGLTPELDKLASESLVFRHAYTAAPHTSYALASLLTAKFIKPVSELSSAPQDHKTLPDVLRRYGYRTAAFYPPAVFYVDGARFKALADRSFGFEYKKEMFASAEQRVSQLADYLAQADPKRTLFIWLHLFEPHEPYDPPRELATADTARGRYEGEVRFADRAIARLVQTFRAARPGGTVIVSADHGEEFGDHGGSYHGTTLFEEQVHVPLLWSSPGVVKPAVTDVPVELVDVGSTILRSAGILCDARMRGDDLSAVLAGAREGPKYAFASVEDRHMVSDGRYKAICSAGSLHCQLFDLLNDPKEQKNLAGIDPERVAALRRQLFAFLSSIAKREVLAVEQGVSFPEPLVRARLGAPGAGEDVLPLLTDARASVREAAARVLGELSVVAALPLLRSLSGRDADPSVRAEAAIAALLMGAEAEREPVAALLAHTDAGHDGLSLKRRAALALALRNDARAVPWLCAWARDASAQETERLRAIVALGQLGQQSAVESLIAILPEVRLREATAHALAQIGGQAAADALYEALSAERNEPARAAEAAALVKLGDARVVAQIERFLGMDTSIPSGVRLLLELGLLRKPSARGASLLAPGTRRGAFSCDERGCVPGQGARLLLAPNRTGQRQRITLLVSCDAPGVSLRVAGVSYRCAGGEQQLSFTRAGNALELPVESDGPVSMLAWVSVPELPEIPPPAPEPWDAGVDSGP